MLTAIEKAANYFAERQNDNGSWTLKPEEIKHNEPLEYQKPLILTCEAIETLSLAKNPKFVPNIAKGMNYCLSQADEITQGFETLSHKIKVLRLAKTTYASKQLYECINLLIKNQSKEGFWPHFPMKTYNLTNFYVISSLKYFDCPAVLAKHKDWLLKHVATDKTGWGPTGEDSESQVSFTANAILSLLNCGENPASPIIQKARKFLESKQFSDGGWPSSKTTVADKSTTYATALVLQAFMLISENPFNKKIEDGIKFLLSMQLPNGGWPLVKGEKPTCYTTMHVVNTLAIYDFFKQNKNRLANLRNYVTSSQFAALLLANEFERSILISFDSLLKNAALTSNMLGSTADSIQRRIEIIKILSRIDMLGMAEIIDALKENPKFAHLNKRSHMTLIKNDLDYLKSLHLVFEDDNYRYFIVADILS